MFTGSVLFRANEGTHLIDTITSTLRLPEGKQGALRAFVSRLPVAVQRHDRLCAQPWTREEARFSARQARGWRDILSPRYTQNRESTGNQIS
jgi:hypothetical protein